MSNPTASEQVDRWCFNHCETCGCDIGLEPHVHRHLGSDEGNPPGFGWGFWHKRCYVERRRDLLSRHIIPPLCAIQRLLGYPQEAHNGTE